MGCHPFFWFLISDFTDGYWLVLYRCYGTVNSEGGWLRYHLAPPQYPAKEFAIHRLISSVAAGCVIGLRATITILFCYSEYPNIYPSCPWLLSRLSICYGGNCLSEFWWLTQFNSPLFSNSFARSGSAVVNNSRLVIQLINYRWSSSLSFKTYEWLIVF